MSPNVAGPTMRSPVHRSHVALGAAFARDDDWETPVAYPDPAAEQRALADGVGVTDISARGKIDLRGAIGPLFPRLVRTSEGVEPGVIASLEPAPSEDHPGVLAPISDQWALLFCRPASLEAALERLEQPVEGGGTTMVTDVSSHYAGFAFSGPRAADLLARLSGFDFASNLPPGTCASTRALEVGAIFVHRDLEPPVVELWIGSEYGRYAWESIMAAGHHLGIAPVGRDALAKRGWW